MLNTISGIVTTQRNSAVMMLKDGSDEKWGHKNFLSTFAEKLLMSLSVAKRPFFAPSDLRIHLSLTFMSLT